MKKIIIIVGLLVASNVGAFVPALEGQQQPYNCNQRYMTAKERRTCEELERTRKANEARIEAERKIAEQRQREQEEKARFERQQAERLERERIENERLEAEQKEKERIETIAKVEAQEQEMEELKKLIIELQLQVIELIKLLIAKGVVPVI